MGDYQNGYSNGLDVDSGIPHFEADQPRFFHNNKNGAKIIDFRWQIRKLRWDLILEALERSIDIEGGLQCRLCTHCFIAMKDEIRRQLC